MNTALNRAITLNIPKTRTVSLLCAGRVLSILVSSAMLSPGARASIFSPGFESLRLHTCSGTNSAPPWNHTCGDYLKEYPALSKHALLTGTRTAQSSLTGVNAFSTSASVAGTYDPSTRALHANLDGGAVSAGGPGQVGSLFATTFSEVEISFADAISITSSDIADGDKYLVRFRVPIVHGNIIKTGGYKYSFAYNVDFNNVNAYHYLAAGDSKASSLSVSSGSTFNLLTTTSVNMSISLVATAMAFGSNYTGDGNPPVPTSSTIDLDFANTIDWGGIDSVYNVTQDKPVPDWELHSLFAGVQWDLASPVSAVPEPDTVWLLAPGLAVLCATLRRRRRPRGPSSVSSLIDSPRH